MPKEHLIFKGFRKCLPELRSVFMYLPPRALVKILGHPSSTYRSSNIMPILLSHRRFLSKRINRGFSSVHHKTLILLPSLTSSLSSLCLCRTVTPLKIYGGQVRPKEHKKELNCHYPCIRLYFFNIKIVLLASYIRLLTKIIHMEHLASARHYFKCFKCFTSYLHSNLYGKPITFST